MIAGPSPLAWSKASLSDSMRSCPSAQSSRLRGCFRADAITETARSPMATDPPGRPSRRQSSAYKGNVRSNSSRRFVRHRAYPDQPSQNEACVARPFPESRRPRGVSGKVVDQFASLLPSLLSDQLVRPPRERRWFGHGLHRRGRNLTQWGCDTTGHDACAAGSDRCIHAGRLDRLKSATAFPTVRVPGCDLRRRHVQG